MLSTNEGEITLIKLVKRLSDPLPIDFADVATDFYKRYYSTNLHIFGSGHGSKTHLSCLMKALNETGLKFTHSLLSMSDPTGSGGYREVTNWEEVKKEIPNDVEVVVNWDDWAVTGVSATSSLINILFHKDEIGFKKIESGNTNDLCSQGNYQVVLNNFIEYLGPRRFLEEKFKLIRDPLKTEYEQSQEENARKLTIEELRSKGLLDAISTYRFPNPKTFSDLANEYNVKKEDQLTLFDKIRKFRLKRKALNIADDYMTNTYGGK